MELDDLDALIRKSVRSAFRLETLPQYLVPQEDEEFVAWQAGRPLPPSTPETSPWLRRIQETTANGYRWYRVHILDTPLSAYSRFEIAGYVDNQAAGEEIFLVNRDVHADLAALTEDFWLVDDEIAVSMIYDEDGRFLRPEPVSDVERCRSLRDIALRHALPLDEYLDTYRPVLTA